ncbi:hypothetical protein WOLCODRAFT_137467 [Wolfiporia cocos MD-104 SS10]|uniref:Uncharacterized protein n=1 Tax=Wolfiporia cocos (strain MD-104) TaxID=742152 RepID=A0A2H3JZH4_WOLCO|nr:hypothetical protein WOLCODRAFT_137467 [Wolfiporia cocos MD-104 SS10]
MSQASPCSSPSPPRSQVHFDTRPGIGRGLGTRANTYSAAHNAAAMSSSTTMPVLPRNVSDVGAASGGFLSRMFGSTNKGHEKDREGAEGAETTETHGVGSAFRRLAHSKSALFRSQASQAQAA